MIQSNEGECLSQYFGNNIPEEAIQSVTKKSNKRDYLIGVVNKLANKTKRKNCYTVSWEWSCPELHDIDFEASVIDKAIAQYYNYTKLVDQSLTVKTNETFPTPIPTSFVDKYLKGFDESNNDGEVIESDDCFSDDDGFDYGDLHIDYNVNHESNLGQSYKSIRHSIDLESDISMTLDTKRGNRSSKSERIYGLKWEMNGNLQAPSGLGIRQKTKIRSRNTTFSTELESLLAFLPLRFWVYHMNECNRYVHLYLLKKEPPTKKFVGMNWKPIKIDELMIFYAIIIQMACRPFPGKRYDECWNYTQDWFTNCKQMNKTRFKQIRAALHWCDNPHSTSKEDTLYKVRPMINILERTIGMYLEVGPEIALDETTIGLYHVYAKALTYYNPAKPRGKHHCKLFVLCENDYWAAINFKFSHRSYQPGNERNGNNSQTNKQRDSLVLDVNNLISEIDEDNSHSDNENMNFDEEIPKMVNLVTSLCKCIKGTGVVVNMDNLYSSPEVFIRLKEMGIYARGTFRSNRNNLPSFIKFSKKETLKLPRGCFRQATNAEHNLSCYAWNDKNPVHILSSADGTEVDKTQRRIKSKKIDVLCPVAVKRYNLGMQGVDQFNKLLTLFSLAKLKFDKYYKKIAMVLLDFAITNAYLHFQIANDTKKDKKYSRVVFMENLQDQMINIDWADKIRRFNMSDSDDESYSPDGFLDKNTNTFDEIMKIGDHADRLDETMSPIKASPTFCNPVAMQPSSMFCKNVSDKTFDFNSQLINLPDSKRVCQICDYEGRGRRRTGVNYCPTHRIRACTLKNPDPKSLTLFSRHGVINDIVFPKDTHGWLCPDSSLTCWEKAHSFYIPNGLFNIVDNDLHLCEDSPNVDFHKVSKINWSSSLYKERKKQLKNVMLPTDPSRLSTPSKKRKKSFKDNDNTAVMDQLKSVLDKDVDVPIINYEDEVTKNLFETDSNKTGDMENDILNDNKVN